MSEESRIGKWLGFWPWLAAVLTGVLTALCFAPFEQTWICWIALTPLLAAVWFSGEGSKRRWLRDLFLGYVAGVVFFWGVFYWLYTVTVPGLILVGLYMGVYFGLWSWLAGLVRPGPRRAQEKQKAPNVQSASGGPASNVQLRNPLPNESPETRSPWLNSFRNLGLALILAAGWTSLEWVRSWMFSGWGWNGLGVPLHDVLPIIQIAEFTGVAGLSFVVAFANVIGVATVRRFTIESRVRVRRPHYDFTLTLAAIVGLCGYGIRLLQVPAETEELRVAAVQANVPRDEKFGREFQAKTFAQFTRLTRLALATQPPPQLIIWPESSTPGPALLDEENYRFVMDLSASIKTDLLLGTIDA
ncbi:MAG TPA: hypothetical protein VNW28_05520, partial [Chthoniobacterales bacterium]|nr:hypothetical protein [Chthoniobacterales bacterium]